MRDFDYYGYEDYYEPDEEETDAETDVYAKEAEARIIEVIGKEQVVTDREIKVRLEDEFFPWVTGEAMRRLITAEQIEKRGYPGRRKSGRRGTRSFYALKGTEYEEIKESIEEKGRISNSISTVLTGTAPASDHAEDLFWDAFQRMDFEMHGRDVSNFRNRSITGTLGKEPPNLDFVIERDGVIYGVDVKDWIHYESVTREEVTRKVGFALELDVVPFIVARYVDEDTIYTGIYQKGGITYRFRQLLVSSEFSTLAERAKRILGYPVLATDRLPNYMLEWMEKLHSGFIRRKARKLRIN